MELFEPDEELGTAIPLKELVVDEGRVTSCIGMSEIRKQMFKNKLI